MDNSPLWDASLRRIEPKPGEVPAYRRVDTTIVDAADRPTNDDYDRYMYLVKLFADRDYDEARIAPDCPFLIQSVLFNALLCQAERDLAEIARVLGEDTAPFEEQAERTARALDAKLWNEAESFYKDFDMVVGTPIDAHVVGGFAPLFAGIPSAERARRLYEHLDSPAFCGLDETCYPVPSNSRSAADFSPNRYWRGPVWIQINWLLERGLRQYGYKAYADRIRRAILELPRDYGFYEYFNPLTGQGHGTSQFSWTAALLIDILYRP
jgi:glycogen debranching enzyme